MISSETSSRTSVWLEQSWAHLTAQTVFNTRGAQKCLTLVSTVIQIVRILNKSQCSHVITLNTYITFGTVFKPVSHLNERSSAVHLSLYSSSCTPLIGPSISDHHASNATQWLFRLQCVVSVVSCLKSNNLPSLNCLASPLRWEQGWRCASGPGAPTGKSGACGAWSRAGPRRGAQQRPKKGGRQKG